MNQPRSLIPSALIIATLHFMLSLLLSIVVFAAASGSSLSDSYQIPSPLLKALTSLLLILQAPVALIQWLIINNHSETHTGLGLQYLVLLGAIWSAMLGCLVSALKRKLRIIREAPATQTE